MSIQHGQDPASEILRNILDDADLIGRDWQGRAVVLLAIHPHDFEILCRWDEHEGREPDADFEEEPDLEPNIDDEEDDPHGEDPGVPVDIDTLADILPGGKELAKSLAVPVPAINVLGRHDKGRAT